MLNNDNDNNEHNDDNTDTTTTTTNNNNNNHNIRASATAKRQNGKTGDVKTRLENTIKVKHCYYIYIYIYIYIAFVICYLRVLSWYSAKTMFTPTMFSRGRKKGNDRNRRDDHAKASAARAAAGKSGPRA